MRGDRDNPSRWSHRRVVIVLSLIGCAIALYLSLYQWHVLDYVFEPFFGEGSRRVLRESIVARFLPIPDAFLGVLAYAAEAITAGIGDEDRWRTHPKIVLLFGCISACLGLVAAFLLIAQPLIVHAWCFLCVCSAVISLVLVYLAAPEVFAAAKFMEHPTMET